MQQGAPTPYLLRRALAAVVLMLPLLSGCRSPQQAQSTPTTAPEASLSSTPPALGMSAAVSPEKTSLALAHYAAAVSLDLEAASLERLYGHQRLRTGTIQPSLLRDAKLLRSKAQEELAAARLLLPSSPEVLRLEGDVLVKLGRSSEALELYKQAQTLGNASPRWYFRTSNQLELLGRLDEAAWVLRSAVDESGVLTGEMRQLALLELGRLYDASGKLLESERALRRALDEMDQAVAAVSTPVGKAFAAGIQRDPTGVRRMLVGVLIKQGKFGAATDEAAKALETAPSDHRALKSLVDAHTAAGQSERAIERVQRFVEDNPESRAGVMSLMKLLEKGNRPGEAIEAGKRFLATSGDDPRVRTEILKLYEKTGLSDEAEQFALDEAGEAATVAESIALLDVYLGAGETEKALALARKVLDENSLDLRVALRLVSKISSALGDEETVRFVETYSADHEGDHRTRFALARLLGGKGRVDESGELFVGLAEAHAPYPKAYEGAALYLIGKGKYFEAGVVLLDGIERGHLPEARFLVAQLTAHADEPGELARRFGGLTEKYESALWDLYELLAGLYSMADENVEAEKYYRKSIDAPVPDPVNYIGLALSLYRQERVGEAIELVEELIGKGQGAPPLVRMLVSMLSMEGRKREARALAEKLILELPTDVDNHLALVGVLIDDEDFDAAEKELLAAKSLAEGDDALLVRVRYYLGIVYEEQGRGVLALSMWEANLAAAPEHADSNNAIAYHYAEAGEKLTEALELIQKALSKDPENAAYLDTLGWVYYKMQRYKKAAEVLAKAAEKMSDAIILDHLGDALLRTGDRDGALEAWKKSLENKPKETDRDATEEKIRSNTAPAEGEVQEKPGGEGDGGS